MNRICSLLLFLGMALFVNAENYLNIHQKDGTIVRYGFQDKPKVYYQDASILIKTTNEEISYPITNLAKFTFDEDESALDNITLDNPKYCQTIIYDMNGRLIKTFPSGELVDLSDIPTGNYIIKSNNVNYKIQKR